MKKKSLVLILAIVLILVLVIAVIVIISQKGSKEENIRQIESFEYNYGSMSGAREYKIYTENEKTYIIAKGQNGIDLDINKEIEKNILNDISKIVEENNINKWNGFKEIEGGLLEGNSFELKIKYVDGGEINARGYMKYPNNYEVAHKKLSTYLEKLK